MKRKKEKISQEVNPIDEMLIQDAIGQPIGISQNRCWLLDHRFINTGDHDFERRICVDNKNFACLLEVRIASDGTCIASMSDIDGYLVYLAEGNFSRSKMRRIFGPRYFSKGNCCGYTVEDFTGSSAEEVVRAAILDAIRIMECIRKELKASNLSVEDSRQEYLDFFDDDESEQ